MPYKRRTANNKGKQSPMRLHRRALTLATVFALAASAATAQTKPVDPAVYEKLDVFAHVLEKIRTSYVEPVTETDVIENAINGMLTSLDPHSSYMKPDEFRSLQEQTQGEFGGLGIEVTMDNGLVKVVSPIEDTPAAQAGLQSGDLITRINDKDVQGMTLKDAVDNMRGKPDSKVKLIIYRESEKRTFDVTLTRAVIKVKPVKSKLMANGVGYVRITAFNDYTDASLKDHLAALAKDNKGPLSGLIVDLRNNPGGLLNQAIAVSDEFLATGEIVSTRGRIEGQNARYSAREGDVLEGKPLVVLINGGSASAAEIVAGALKDNKRSITVGTKSFGKGSVQTVFNLPGGAGMRLTTALYYTPSGNSIQAKGITPDIEAKQPLSKEAKSSGFDESDLPSEASLVGHIVMKPVSATDKDGNGIIDASATPLPVALQGLPPMKDTTPTVMNLENKPDAQLQRAVEVMQALTAWPKGAAIPATPGSDKPSAATATSATAPAAK